MKSIRADRQATKCKPSSDGLEVKKLSLEAAFKALLQLREIRVLMPGGDVNFRLARLNLELQIGQHVLLHSGRSCNSILERSHDNDVVSVGQDSNRREKLCDMEEQGVDTVAEKYAGGDIALTDTRGALNGS